MEIIGKLQMLLSVQSGKGKNGAWKKQDFIIETESKYPKKVCISVWNDKIDVSQIPIGSDIKVDFDVESREYNERWYTELRAWQITMDDKVIRGNPTPGDDDHRTKLIGDLDEMKALLNFSIHKKSTETTLHKSKESDSPDDIIRCFDDAESTE